jgi:hypothetical protein
METLKDLFKELMHANLLWLLITVVWSSSLFYANGYSVGWETFTSIEGIIKVFISLILIGFFILSSYFANSPSKERFKTWFGY